MPTFLRPVAGDTLKWAHLVDKSETFLSLNICYVIGVLLWIKYCIMWFESRLVFILFKFKKRPNISVIRVVYWEHTHQTHGCPVYVWIGSETNKLCSKTMWAASVGRVFFRCQFKMSRLFQGNVIMLPFPVHFIYRSCLCKLFQISH